MGDCFFFGCWKEAGHFLFTPNGLQPPYRDGDPIKHYGDKIRLDSTLAPRQWKPQYNGPVTWVGSGKTCDARDRLGYDSVECPEGQYLHHVLDNGFTAIAWWDRNQGDTRPGCSSTILLRGEHTSEEMLAAARVHSPHILANLEKAGVKLVEISAPQEKAG